MEDIKKMKVVEHNDLITSVAKMDKIPMKIFELAVSCIDTSNPPDNNTVYISKKALFEFFDVDDSNKYSRFKKYLKALHSQSTFEIRQKSLTKKNKYIEKLISPISSSSWSNDDDDDVVEITFHEDIMPFLIELNEQGKFTQYMISDIKNLASKHSIVLYKWLIMNFNQYKFYEYSSLRTKDQKEKLKNPSISVNELRRITDTKTEYERFTNFEKWVIENPLKEINEHTHLIVDYEKEKNGRKISSIKFYITEKPIKKAVPLDDDYLESRMTKEERERELQVKYFNAMQHEYTGLLTKYFIIRPADMQNVQKMADFYEFLYPVYENIESIKGRNEKLGLKEHLTYMRNKLSQKSEQPKDLLKYLIISAENHINRIRTNYR